MGSNQYPNQGKIYNQNKRNNNTIEWKNHWKDEWITNGPDPAMVEFADKISEVLVNNKLTTNQIRNVFGEIIRIKLSGINENKTAFLMLKPKLAYAAARAKDDKRGDGANLFKEIITKAMDLVLEKEQNDEEFEKRFNNFHALFESILAYHKVHNGK